MDIKHIIDFLKRNEFPKLSRHTIKTYVKEAKRIVKEDFRTNAWFTEKVQDAYAKDYKESWENHDEILNHYKNYVNFMVTDAKRASREVHGNEDRYQFYIPSKLFLETLAGYRQANMEKIELMKTGLINYRIKRYIEALQDGGNLEELKKDPIVQSINRSPLVIMQDNKSKNEIVEGNTDTNIDNDLELPEHLKPFEEKLNKKLTTL